MNWRTVAVGCLPEAELPLAAVFVYRNQGLAVAKKLQSQHGIGELVHGEQLSACGHIPQPDRAIATGRCQGPAVGGKCCVVDDFRVRAKDRSLAKSICLPELGDVAIGNGVPAQSCQGNQRAAVGGKPEKP